jgi:hypothetical protein
LNVTRIEGLAGAGGHSRRQGIVDLNTKKRTVLSIVPVDAEFSNNFANARLGALQRSSSPMRSASSRFSVAQSIAGVLVTPV